MIGNRIDPIGPVQTSIGIDRRRPADCDGTHSALSGEDAAVIPFAAAIDASTRCEDPVNPAFKDCRQPKPPERKLKDQGIAPEKLVHLRLDVGSKPIVDGSSRLLGLLAIVVRVVHGREVAAIRHRIEAHRIKVGDNDLVPSRSQRLLGHAGQGAVEAVGLRVSVNDEDAHRAFPPGRNVYFLGAERIRSATWSSERTPAPRVSMRSSNEAQSRCSAQFSG